MIVVSMHQIQKITSPSMPTKKRISRCWRSREEIPLNVGVEIVVKSPSKMRFKLSKIAFNPNFDLTGSDDWIPCRAYQFDDQTMIVYNRLEDGKTHHSIWAYVGFIHRRPSVINPLLKFVLSLIDMTKVVKIATAWIHSFRICQCM